MKAFEGYARDHVIHAYSREQAIEDGFLVDVSESARQAGIRFPVAVSRLLWASWIDPEDADVREGQSSVGRLWDVVVLLRRAIVRVSGDRVEFVVSFRKGGELRDVRIKAVCGPGDLLEPVITVMLPEED